MKSFDVKLFSIILIICLGFIGYSNTFFCSFHFDDFAFVANPYIRNIHDLQNIWDWWPCRFITFLSFAINYHFYHLNVFGYHAFNLAVHLMAAILVWWFVNLTFLTPVMKEERISQHASLISLFTGLVFVAHPIQTQAVTFIWQRAASMAALFYLASLCFYIKSRIMENGPSASNHQKFYYLGSVIAAILAIFTKENAITLPMMILFYEICFLKSGKTLNLKRFIPFLFILLIIPVMWVLTDSEKAQARQSFVTNISSMQYLLTEFRVMLTYIRLVILPIHQNLDYDYSLSKSIFEAPALFSFIFLVIILFFAKRLYSKYRLISFSIFWFFLTLLPESSVFPFADVIFEHRLYLPMVGGSILLVSGVYYVLGSNNIKMMAVILTMLIVGYSILTYQRNEVWKDNISLWNDAVSKSPNKARAHNNRGKAYLDQGNVNQALSDFNKAIELNPSNADAYNNRGSIYLNQGNFLQALIDFNKSIEFNPNNAEAYNNRSSFFVKQGDFAQALSDLHKAIEINPLYANAYYNRGLIYDKLGFFNQAIEDITKAIEINDSFEKAFIWRGLIFLKLRNFTRAVFDLTNAIEINPNDAVAYSDRGSVYGEGNSLTQAISDFTKAIEINPQYAQAYYNRAGSYYKLKGYDNAWSDVHKAEVLGYVVDPGFINALKKVSGRIN